MSRIGYSKLGTAIFPYKNFIISIIRLSLCLMKKIVFSFVCILMTQLASAQLYGKYWGANLNIYKSNLFNADDVRADSFQKYKMTPGVGGSIEYGYLYENGISYSFGLQFGTNNQSYVGNAITGSKLTMEAKTKLSYLKIPFTVTIQHINDKKTKFLYSIGAFYSYNLAYSDIRTFSYSDGSIKPYEMTIKKEVLTANIVGDTAKATYDIKDRPYHRHGIGASAGIGFSRLVKEKVELITQLKGEFQISNAENTDENTLTPTGATSGYPQADYVYGNYAKYMYAPGKNENRAATHPFTIGLTIGLRFYLFDFN